MVSLNGCRREISNPGKEDFLCNDMQRPLRRDSEKPKKMSIEGWRIFDQKMVGYIF